MSFNYQGPQGFGYGPNTNSNQNALIQPNINPYQSLGYGSNVHQNKPVNLPSQQIRFSSPNVTNDPYNTKASFNANSQIQTQSNYSNSYSQQNPFQQPYQKYPDQTNQNMPIFANLFQSSGSVNQIKNQGPANSQKQRQLQNDLNVWVDIAKLIDLDSLLRQKNTAKKQSDTSWVTHQQQSWLQQKPSNNIQIQTKRKFEFPNPYIKYKIIPGVDQTMSLDVTSKNQPQKGYFKGTLIIWDYHGGPNQQFYIHRIQKGGWDKNSVENDEFMLINAATGFVVSAFNLNTGSQKNANGICVCPKMKESANQRWKFRRVKQNTDIFLIQSVDTGNVLDCEGGSRSNGTNVIQWKSNNQRNQMWKILPA